MKKMIYYFFIFLFLISCTSTDTKKQDKKEEKKVVLPKAVEELIVPSGFDSEYVMSLKNKKPAKFIKPMIRIMKFEIPQTFLKAINDFEFKMDEKLKAEIAKTGRYTLLGSESDIKAALEEQKKIGMDEFTKEGSTIDIGNLKIAGYTLTGKITQSYPDVKQVGGYFSLNVAVEVSLTITNANTGVIEFTDIIKAEKEEKLFVNSEGMIIQGPRNLTDKPLNSIRATGKDIDLSPQYREALAIATEKIINYLEEKIPIMGEVIGVNDNEIMATPSQLHGIKKGDYLFILRVGDPLTDSSGKVLGFSKTVIGVSVVKSVEKTMSVSEIVKLKDSSKLPQKGDIIISLPSSVK